jgi:AraC-like DNA-binding protein
MNPALGLSYFTKALKYARLADDECTYHSVLCNLAMAYHRQGDTAGLIYSLEVLDIGIARNDPYLTYCGAIVTASMHYLMNDYPTALKYMEMAIDKGGEYADLADAYSLYANILVRLGREREAVDYYHRSLEHIGEDRNNILAYTNYGNYLVEKGRYGAAIEILEQGLAYIDKRNNAHYRYRLYEKLSEAYERAGLPYRALSYYKKFHVETDSVFNLSRERAIDEFRIKYEHQKQKKEIQKQKLAFLRQRQKLNVTVSATLLFIGVSVMLWISIRSKNRRYRQIVRQQHELLRKEKMIDDLSEKYTASSLSQEMGQSLFARFEKLVKSEKIFRDSGITIDKVAKSLSTNRSYLSQVINENSGGSFLQYITSARIDEARRILSGPAGDEVQIKSLAYELGFSTPATFSSSFKSAIGMLPSKFRAEMRK